MEHEATGAIVARNLSKTYKGGKNGAAGVRALDGLSFCVQPGTVYALLGPNGAGKTTTVRILTTLSRPDAGSAAIAGIDVLSKPDRVRSVIGAVSQHSGAMGRLTGEENLFMQGGLYGMRGRDLRQRVSGLLDVFGLAEAAGRQARTYSGGMRRRLDIATVLVHRPAVLFLDEPTTGLDPEARADLWAVLSDLTAAGTTILITTHYLEEADQYAAKIAIVDRGRMVAEGTADELKDGLRGDSIVLELDSAEGAARAEKVLVEVPEVTGSSVHGGVVRARVADGPRALPAVLGGIEASRLSVRSVTVARPSLDDVYLHHSGHSLRQSEGISAA
jgi:ABC-2 type transport system ATP-binding protein